MNLYDRLRAAGIEDEEAQTIAKDHAAETVADIDADRLTKAMEHVAQSFGDAAPTSAVDEAVQEASDIVDAVTRGADALLAEQRTQYEALAKGILALGDEVRELRTRMTEDTAELAKSLSAVSDEPVERRSRTTDLEVIPAPGDSLNESPVSYQGLITKALTEMRESESHDRQTELRRAVSMLESGFPASHIQNQFGI